MDVHLIRGGSHIAAMSSYHLPEYWNQRYQQDTEPFEWYQKYEDIKSKIRPYIKDESKVLVVGCGNSPFSFEMYDDGVKNIDNIDISDVVISQMAAKVEDREGMTFKTMDCTEMDYPDKSYDAIIDKGTMDAILCGEGGPEKVGQYLTHCSRILRPRGTLIVVSYANPDMRSLYLDRPEYGWTVKTETVPKPRLLDTPSRSAESHYIYILTRSQ